ncbi:MAG: SDR family NAD(P)-dependent oxidoreductase, partial [Ginsengibacter sp.]
MDYQNKTVIITGAANGIGASCARLFYEAGANVILIDIAKDESGIASDRWLFINCDISSERQVKEAFEKAWSQFGSVDILVNNAGIQRYGTVTETTGDEWDLVMNVNLKSLFLCSKYAIPFMLE